MAKHIPLPPTYPIPENWKWVEMEKLTVMISGYPFDSGKFSNDSEGRKGIIRIRDILRGTTTTFTDESCPDEYIIHYGDILVGMDGDFNVAKWQSEDAVLNQRVCYIYSAISALLNDYLFYYLPEPLKKINDATPSVTVKHLSTNTLGKTSIPLPPLPEQQRIVNRIESLFAKLDAAKEKAQAVVYGFEERKAAVLHKAFTGKLTEKWRKEHGIQFDSWRNVHYEDLGTSKLGKMLDSQKNKGLPALYLRNINVRWFSFDLSDIGTMLVSEDERSELSVKQGDLFICEGGEPGRCAVWKEGDSNFIFQKALHRFRPNKMVISEYVAYNLYYMNLNGSLKSYFTGTTIKHLTGKSLAKIPILLPSREEQYEIIRYIDQYLEKEKQTNIKVERVLDQISLMKKSILAHAFRGELGTNDPNDESAEELLKRVL